MDNLLIKIILFYVMSCMVYCFDAINGIAELEALSYFLVVFVQYEIYQFVPGIKLKCNFT